MLWQHAHKIYVRFSAVWSTHYDLLCPKIDLPLLFHETHFRMMSSLKFFSISPKLHHSHSFSLLLIIFKKYCNASICFPFHRWHIFLEYVTEMLRMLEWNAQTTWCQNPPCEPPSGPHSYRPTKVGVIFSDTSWGAEVHQSEHCLYLAIISAFSLSFHSTWPPNIVCKCLGINNV